MNMQNILCLIGASVGLCFSGCESDALPTCQTKDTEFRICDQNKVYRCPVGNGASVEMELVSDCSATGDICAHDLVSRTASCEDPNHIVGDDAATYSEQDDAANDDAEGAENTGYLLDDAGLVISGSLGKDDVDHFIVQAGYSPKIDVRLLRDGKKSSGTLTLHPAGSTASVVTSNDGDIINGSMNMWPAGYYVLSIQGAAEGAYTLELKAH